MLPALRWPGKFRPGVHALREQAGLLRRIRRLEHREKIGLPHLSNALCPRIDLRLTHLPELPAQFQIPDYRFRLAALEQFRREVLVRAEGIELRRSLGFRRRDQVPLGLSHPLGAQCHAPERAVSVMDGVSVVPVRAELRGMAEEFLGVANRLTRAFGVHGDRRHLRQHIKPGRIGLEQGESLFPLIERAERRRFVPFAAGSAPGLKMIEMPETVVPLRIPRFQALQAFQKRNRGLLFVKSVEARGIGEHGRVVPMSLDLLVPQGLCLAIGRCVDEALDLAKRGTGDFRLGTVPDYP